MAFEFRLNTSLLVSAHGIPRDLLDRLLIIRTLPYTQEEMAQIVKIRAGTEGLQIDDDTLNVLSEMGSRTTLRYAVQLLTPSAITARISGRQNIARDDIKVCLSLFRIFPPHFISIIYTGRRWWFESRFR